MIAFLALHMLYVVALVCFVFVPWFFPLLNPFLAMMSSAGYSHARFLLSSFFSFLFRPCSSPICFGMAISPTGGVFSYLPHHLDLASKDSVGHSTCMSVLERRRAIIGSIVQAKSDSSVYLG